MEKFVFHHPVKIIFGRNALESAGKEVAQLGKRVLLVQGRSALRENGTRARLINHLLHHELTLFELEGIRPHPLLSDVRTGIKIVREHGCNVVAAIGGGSVIDTAKAIAAGAMVNHDVWKFFTGKKSVRSRLPLVTIPTIAGSGSEINHGLVLTNDENQLKFGFGHRLLIPDVCIADPTLTYTVPPELTGAGGVDVLCHCLEPYLSTSADGIGLQRRFIESISRTLIETVPACIREPESYAARSAMLWCAMTAMSGYPISGLGKIYFPLHALEHGVSAHTGIAHGHGLAALLPGWIDFHRADFGDRICAWGQNVLGIESQRDGAGVDEVIAAVRSFLTTIRCPVSLTDAGCSPDIIDSVVDHALAQARIWRLKNLTAESARAILDRSFQP